MCKVEATYISDTVDDVKSAGIKLQHIYSFYRCRGSLWYNSLWDKSYGRL